jgi:hypothetical protein
MCRGSKGAGSDNARWIFGYRFPLDRSGKGSVVCQNGTLERLFCYCVAPPSPVLSPSMPPPYPSVSQGGLGFWLEQAIDFLPGDKPVF